MQAILASQTITRKRGMSARVLEPSRVGCAAMRHVPSKTQNLSVSDRYRRPIVIDKGLVAAIQRLHWPTRSPNWPSFAFFPCYASSLAAAETSEGSASRLVLTLPRLGRPVTREATMGPRPRNDVRTPLDGYADHERSGVPHERQLLCVRMSDLLLFSRRRNSNDRPNEADGSARPLPRKHQRDALKSVEDRAESSNGPKHENILHGQQHHQADSFPTSAKAPNGLRRSRLEYCRSEMHRCGDCFNQGLVNDTGRQASGKMRIPDPISGQRSRHGQQGHSETPCAHTEFFHHARSRHGRVDEQDRTASGNAHTVACERKQLVRVRDWGRPREESQLWHAEVAAGVEVNVAAVELAAAAPLSKCSLSDPADANGVLRGACHICYSRSKRQGLRGGGPGAMAQLKLDMVQAPPGLSGGAEEVAHVMGLHAERVTFQAVHVPDWDWPSNCFEKVRLTLADWDVAPRPRRVEVVPACQCAPKAAENEAAALPVAQKMYHKMDPGSWRYWIRCGTYTCAPRGQRRVQCIFRTIRPGRTAMKTLHGRTRLAPVRHSGGPQWRPRRTERPWVWTMRFLRPLEQTLTSGPAIAGALLSYQWQRDRLAMILCPLPDSDSYEQQYEPAIVAENRHFTGRPIQLTGQQVAPATAPGAFRGRAAERGNQ